MEFTNEHEPQHPMVSACAVVDEVLDEMAGSDPVYMDPTSKRHSLAALSILIDRLEGIRLGVLAASGDVARADGARPPAPGGATPRCRTPAPRPPPATSPPP